ncbi:UNVERIFIED_CONTAM: hypothetical protein K2H54_056857 [Gekko kuhli]
MWMPSLPASMLLAAAADALLYHVDPSRRRATPVKAGNEETEQWCRGNKFYSLYSWTHNIQREKEFLRKLVKARVITDLTSGI